MAKLKPKEGRPSPEALRELREARGWSGQELARRAGMSRMAVHYLEKGARSPGLDTAARLRGPFLAPRPPRHS